MDLTADLLHESLSLAGHLLFWPLVLLALTRAPWRILRDPDAARVWIATMAVVLVLWQIFAEMGPLHAHILGAAAMTLMFRWSFAVIGLTVVLLVSVLDGHGDWSSVGINGLVMVALPVSVVYTLWRLNERVLPPNLFVYVFFAAFAGGLVSMAAAGIASEQFISLAGDARDASLGEYRAAWLMLMYPEGFLTGVALSIFVVFRPQWVATFDDARYLRARPR